MLTTAQKSFLSALFPGDALALDAVTLAAFSMDASQKQAMPWAVVRPENTEQISALLKWAQAERMPIYPRARATNKVGETVPVCGGVVVSTLRMNKILDIDAGDFIAEVQPGVVTSDLAEQAARQRLFYPPDPASVRSSTVGGNVATCAGGLRAVKYGVTRDYVLGVEAVIPGGEVVTFGSRCHKDVVGLDLTRLFVGAAGTLGIVTKLTVKLLPLPEARASVLAVYDSPETAIGAAHAVFAAGILPAACEFMDQTTMAALHTLTGESWLSGAGGAILMQVDGLAEAVEAERAKVEAVLRQSGPMHVLVGSGEEETKVWEMRRSLSQACFTIAPDKLSEDIALPRGHLPQAVRELHAIGQKHDVAIMIYGHLGDGNLHVNTMYDAADQAMAEQAANCRAEVVALALALGGTASGEHGLGLSKKHHLANQIAGTELDLMRRVKAVFDPHSIMNPGKEWA